jgi:hypothetical protein
MGASRSCCDAGVERQSLKGKKGFQGKETAGFVPLGPRSNAVEVRTYGPGADARTAKPSFKISNIFG